MKEKIPFEDVHELLEEPVEEQVGHHFTLFNLSVLQNICLFGYFLHNSATKMAFGLFVFLATLKKQANTCVKPV